jgi:amino acid adenylation domain-containing protein
MVPSAFITLAQLPLLPNGKVDRRALPVPDWTDLEQTTPLVAPRDSLEQQVADIWAEVLKHPRIGIHDNFFELGGHSLLATQVVSRLQQALSINLPLRLLFEFPTIAELRQHFEVMQSTVAAKALPPIKRVDRSQPLALSFAQQRLWFLNQLTGSSAIYNMPAAVRLQGVLQVEVLEQVVSEMVHRHEPLRTVFAVVDEMPIQAINPPTPQLVPVIDLQNLPAAAQRAEIERLATEEAQQPFDLAQGSLLRARLLRLSAEDHVLLTTMHHIISDGWSMGVFIRESIALYMAFVEGQASPLPPLPIQYADYAHWQRQWLQGEVLEQQLDYWRQQLGRELPVLNLPTDRPRPAVQTYRGDQHAISLSTDLTSALNRLSQQANATLFMTLLAAFQTLLYRYCGQEDIIVGSPIAGRRRSELEDLIGFFVNTLALRTDLSGNPSFRELLGRVRQVALEAYTHQDIPFEKLVEELKPARDSSRSPVFQAMFVLQNAPSAALTLPGLTLTPLSRKTATAKFDLTLSLTETASGLQGSFEYNTDLFEAATIERMAGHFQTLLAGIVANPEQSITTLPILTETEHHQLLVEWNDTRVDYLQDRCIHQLFEEQVERTPDAIAVVFEEQQLTYQELNARANQLAHYLQSLGVGPEVLVGICVERSLEMLVGLLGILKAGGAYVPIDPAYPQERQVYMLQDSQVAVLLTQATLAPTFPTSQAQVVCLDANWSDISGEKTTNLERAVQLDELAYVIYTSGSTGKPKGVLIPHRGLINCLTAMRPCFGLTDQDSWLAVTTISFDVAALELYSPLIAGARLILASRSTAADGPQLKALLNDTAATFMVATPATYFMLLVSGWEPNAALTILCGGEALTQDLAAQLLPKAASLWNLYGPTETTIFSTCCKIEPADAPISIGHPIANTQLYILDPHLQPVPLGAPGELYIGGDGLARGYLNRPQLTAERFIRHPFMDVPGSRLYKTGDLARFLPDGRVEYLGRIDHQVKIRGFRIELGEIESVLSQYPAIQHCVVVAREDQPGDRRLVAYMVTASDPPSTGELRSFLKEMLPEYMIPSIFITLESLPLTPNGKVDRKALPPPKMANAADAATYVAPRTFLEQELAKICAQVLNLERVGIYDNFFEVGGHSLLATQVIARVQQMFQVEFPLQKLFEEPTIACLAEQIETYQLAAKLALSAPPAVNSEVGIDDPAGEDYEVGGL